MKRDSVKTAVGLFIIAGIVVATFLYGNSQRQAQLRHDQDVKNEQAKATATSPSASATVKPAASPTPVIVDGAPTRPSVIPDTGARESGLIGLAAITFASVLWRASRARVLRAVRIRE